MENKIENVIITNTQLGYEEHGIFTCMLFVKGDGWGCGFGGYALDTFEKETDERVATKQGFQTIIEILKTLELEKWEDLKGQYVRVETQGWGGKITKIGHLIKNKWFSFEEHFNKNK